jgi:excisionase family DNA binding protein
VQKLLSPRELAERTGVPRSTWYDLIHRGEIPFVRIASSLRVAEGDLQSFIESRREVAR